MVVPIEIIVPPDDLSVTVPAEKTELATVYRQYNLTDHSGNKLTDHSGNYLIITQGSSENVYVVNVPPDDLSVTVPEEA